MNYNLNDPVYQKQAGAGTWKVLRRMLDFIGSERKKLLAAMAAILLNAAVLLSGPYLVGYTIDRYISHKNFTGVWHMSLMLLALYLTGFITSYLQTQWMGSIGQQMLYALRNAVFGKVLELPLAFFQQNKAGDLISRINNDTDRVNQFFSQSLMQFIGNLMTMLGTGICLLSIQPELGVVCLAPALVLLVFTRLASSWVKRKNKQNLQSLGGLSAEIQESLENFKVIVVFKRRDYFRDRFRQANQANYQTSIWAGIANTLFIPVFGLCSSLAQLAVLAMGIYLISSGQFTVGLLISYLAYVYLFYSPLRQLAALWANFQLAMAAWDRIATLLGLENDLKLLPAAPVEEQAAVLEFRDVSFGYESGKPVLAGLKFRLESGKTYAVVGPTGGGKSTLASLMARLYDPWNGEVLLQGRDLRSLTGAERSRRIGFILQEPFVFSGTIMDNLSFGSELPEYRDPEFFLARLQHMGMMELVSRFGPDPKTALLLPAQDLSLGQKQLMAFMRAVLREPDLLILDEASANIDTLTEQLLDQALQRLPASTTKVIIAHRLNTIENADDIYFINAGSLEAAGSMEHAMDMLMHQKRSS